MASLELKALVVFRNLMCPALIRSVHVYRSEGGEGEKEVEREYVFHRDSDYEEISFCKVFTLQKFRVSSHFEGLVNGVWLCIFVFDVDRHCAYSLERLPTFLQISRNPKLNSIPTLANDLQTVTQLSSRVENKDKCRTPIDKASKGKEEDESQLRTHQMCDVDLNSLPSSLSDNEGSDQCVSEEEVLFSTANVPSCNGFVGGVEKKRKRAKTRAIANLALEDLAKYFDLPIIEASKNLKVGLTVLKKKCREFGIPRWPHRKIKSLDSLIHELREEVKCREEEDKFAALAVKKKQRMVESEKKTIEQKPFMEIQTETRKFRQHMFKRRHKARALRNQCRSTFSFL